MPRYLGKLLTSPPLVRKKHGNTPETLIYSLQQTIQRYGYPSSHPNHCQSIHQSIKSMEKPRRPATGVRVNGSDRWVGSIAKFLPTSPTYILAPALPAQRVKTSHQRYPAITSSHHIMPKVPTRLLELGCQDLQSVKPCRVNVILVVAEKLERTLQRAHACDYI